MAGAGFAAATAFTTVWVGSRLNGKEQWIEATVRRHLPGVRIEPESLATFAQAFARGSQFKQHQQTIAVWLDQAAPSLARQSQKANRRIERLERLAVSEYLSGSNFFRVQDPQSELIVYGGAFPACGNPFARFRDS
jgi:hypothetical protein